MLIAFGECVLFVCGLALVYGVWWKMESRNTGVALDFWGEPKGNTKTEKGDR